MAFEHKCSHWCTPDGIGCELWHSPVSSASPSFSGSRPRSIRGMYSIHYPYLQSRFDFGTNWSTISKQYSSGYIVVGEEDEDDDDPILCDEDLERQVAAQVAVSSGDHQGEGLSATAFDSNEDMPDALSLPVAEQVAASSGDQGEGSFATVQDSDEEMPDASSIPVATPLSSSPLLSPLTTPPSTPPNALSPSPTPSPTSIPTTGPRDLAEYGYQEDGERILHFPFRCKYNRCEWKKSFYTFKEYSNHLTKKHGIRQKHQGGKQLSCQWLGCTEQRAESSLLRHIQTHVKENFFNCARCGKTEIAPRNEKKHRKTCRK
ncbi:hypothetical protein BJ165DRAFT_18563 [Panaeolus papilionaceus]|nr:hypothetical protein BJ165DRAFT_18563 [Panaeolus papilionaceus]